MSSRQLSVPPIAMPALPTHKISGEYYDLSGFEHPGGAWNVAHSAGTDATNLFHVYHWDAGRLVPRLSPPPPVPPRLRVVRVTAASATSAAPPAQPPP